MENENENVQVDVVEQEEQTSEEEVNLENEEQETQDDTITLTKSEFNKLKRKAIAYDSKKEEVKSEPPKVVKQNPQSANSEELIDIKVLKSIGTPDDEIEYLKKIAKVNGTSLIDAKQDDLYKAYVSKKQEEEKAQKAALGASRGAGKKEVQKTTGLTQEEHKELWKKATGLNA